MSFVEVSPYQFAALHSHFEHTAFYGGVGCGKSFTGSHFSIVEMRKNPDLTGFIGANTYDQLSQATLKELFGWLDYYRIPWVIDRAPPREWGASKKFKSYDNVLSCRIGRKTTHAFTRTLSDPDALRGIQIGWYWIDEARDTSQMTHDVLLSRMRQSHYRRGLITTTTNGESWDYHRFVKSRKGQRLYGSLHVKTEEAVRLGILTPEFYNTLRASYSELLGAQELDAMHVNVAGGRAYYAASEHNRRRISPWGERNPNPSQGPLIIGCDFNFDPSPHVWMIGQLGNDPKTGERCIHWFSEIARLRYSTEQMAMALSAQYGDQFFYRVFGDRSGMRATTSNAGKHDYDQIAATLSDAGCAYSIDSDTSNNPLVRNRIENMNRMFKDGRGIIRQTYNPDTCPLFDQDIKMVGWKTNSNLKGQGKLDDGGDKTRTHASDGAGYAIWKLFPFGKRGTIIEGVKNQSSLILPGGLR